ncbi:uncharacterized protein LOC126566183 [Anopheles maculipalpis]|uniref:uncharacterized protein LOC126566183 n=1 Tax=Anopheles maculipalpis TaxID=1496333 RepID=UPI0021591A9A|nr:uncharacterized protein LOC126566183 [Anopheles maculipalpis]
MFTIDAETFDLMKQDVMNGKCLSTSGTLVQSKTVTNRLFWQSGSAPEDLRKKILEIMTFLDPEMFLMDIQSVQQPYRTDSEQPDDGGSASVLDVLSKKMVWEYLSYTNAEQDDCEYCSLMRCENRLFQKHQIYTNGKLSCPVLLKLKTAYRHNRGVIISTRKRAFYSNETRSG